MLAFDGNGIAAVIAAVFAGVAWVIGAWNHRTTAQIRNQVDTGPDAADLGKLVADLAKPPVAPTDPTDTPAP